MSLLGKDFWFYIQLILWLSLCLSCYLKILRDLPGVPVAKTLCSHAEGPGSIPGQGTRSHRL